MTVTDQPVAADIECRDLVRIYTAKDIEVQALQGLNLRVEAGELLAVVGPSGSGKSTLLSILAGLDTPTAGSATVAGVRLGGLRGRDRVDYFRHRVGFVWQQTGRNLVPYLTAAENINLPLRLAGATARRQRVDDLLELLGVAECRDRRPREMSGGEQQRTAIAVALANSPRVLLADEVTGELDEETTADVLGALRGVNEEYGVTTLIVTHDPLVSDHVRRTVQIRDGRTSSEVHQRLRVDASGRGELVSERFSVIDHAGRMQLPEEFVEALSLRDRVRLGLEPDHVTVHPDEETS